MNRAPGPDRSPASGDAAPGLDLAAVRRRLAEARGPRYWRHLEELADSAEFQELVHREFPLQAAIWPEGVDRRRFLQLASASLALGGLTACTRQPIEKIVPYVQQPEEIVPGRPLYFASGFELDGYAQGVLVESHMGRPTKIEGNPDHPASRGATDLFAQASVLGLYDPDRSQVVRQLGRVRGWASFVDENRRALAALAGLGAVRLRLITGTVTSPSLAAHIRRVLAQYPEARWHQYDPAGRHSARAAALLAFGEPVETRYDLARADVIVALDSDFLTAGPGAVRYARDFAARRRLRGGPGEMSRFYAVESVPTATGTLADQRLVLRPGDVGAAALALAAALGLPGAAMPEPFGDGSAAAWIAAAAADLSRHRGRGLVIAGEQAAPAVHALAQTINAALGNTGQTAITSDPVEAEPIDQHASLAALVADMNAGEVDVLIVLGGNPVYDAPAELSFGEAMLNVRRRLHLGLYADETAQYCDWHVPQAHYLESWGDARAYDGTVTLIQPLIEPLYGGKTAVELLTALTAADGEVGGREALKAYWLGQLGEADFERRFRRALHDGLIADSALPHRAVPLRPTALAEAGAQALEQIAPRDGVELVLRPDPTVHDGRFANNGWLQECPKPLTKLTWDNVAMVGPALAQRLGLTTEGLVSLELGGRALELPVWVQPGMPDGTVAVHMGYGRSHSGRVGSGIGGSASLLRPASGAWSTPGVTITPSAGSYVLASTQMHSNMEIETREAARRHPLRLGTLAEFAANRDFVREMGPELDPENSLYPPVEYKGHAWGLTVDLSACTGCNACVIACVSENNIPVVGKEQVQRGREMQWIRIDRYFEGDLDHPEVHHQPVMCMQCEQAPCEVVCPVAATVHSDEGLNQMVYNRCVGTRYCSNNCPYKVRRFNFLKYNDTETPVLAMARNPDVTVRVRGVMEKCTYCVQRINWARIDAKREDRPIRDGEVRTACQQVCPSQAIVFGDINDPDAEVSRWKSDPLNYGVLEELNTRPRTTYLAKVRNPNPELARPAAEES